MKTIEQKFFSRIEMIPFHDCWEWVGAKKQRGGYGTIDINGKRMLAHRYAWMLHHGKIPDGLFVCHHCDNPSCVRPAHLFLGTPKDNSQDMHAKNITKVRYCLRGHKKEIQKHSDTLRHWCRECHNLLRRGERGSPRIYNRRIK